MTLDSTPTGVETLYYGYDSLDGVDNADMVVDNAVVPMSLKAAKIVL